MTAFPLGLAGSAASGNDFSASCMGLEERRTALASLARAQGRAGRGRGQEKRKLLFLTVPGWDLAPTSPMLQRLGTFTHRENFLVFGRWERGHGSWCAPSPAPAGCLSWQSLSISLPRLGTGPAGT